MKKTFYSLLLFFLWVSLYSQAPQKFTYQSVVRNSSGNILKSAKIGIQLSIFKSSNEGTPVYSEEHSTSTNQNGLVTLIIGEGLTSDNISAIDWSTGEYFLKVQVAPLGGINYLIETTSKLLSVPYALYAENSNIDLLLEGENYLTYSPNDLRLVLKKIDLSSNIKGTLPVESGGTGVRSIPMVGLIKAENAAAARTILGVDASGTGSTIVLTTVAENYLTISDSSASQELTAGIVPISLGGTGATDPASARTSLGLGTIATQDNDAVNIDGGAIDGTIIGGTSKSTGAFNTVSSGIYQSNGDSDVILKTGNTTTGNITIANGANGNINIQPDGTGQVVIDDLKFPAADGSANQVLTTDGSGNISFANSTDSSTDVTLATVTDNYLTIDGQEITAGIIPISLGGTGATDSASARTSLGLGTIATQDNDAVNIDGGAIDGTIIGGTSKSTGAFNTVSSGIYQSNGDSDVILKTGNTTTGNITIANGANGNINIQPDGTGQVIIDDLKFPAADGSANQVLTTDGSGNISFANSTDSSTDVTLATVTDNYLTIDGQELTAGIVPISLGGTGATDSASARTSLGLGTIATQDNDAVNIDGGAIDGTIIGGTSKSTGAFNTVSSGIYQSNGDSDVILKTGNTTTGNITIANGANGNINIQPDGTGQVVIDDLKFPAADGSANQVLTTDGSGNISFANSTDSSTDVTLATVTDNYLTIDGQELTAGIVPISLGGTNSATAPMVGVITAADAAAARTVLGVDASGTDGSTAVTLATVTDNYLTISGQELTAGIVPISLGGTNSATAPMVGVITAANAAAAIEALGVNSTAAELNVLDGNSTLTTVTLASSDGIIINDSGVMKQVTLTSAQNYLLGSLSIDILSDALIEDFSMYIGNDPSGTTDTAQFNIAVGATALDAVTTGDKNIAVGYSALTVNQGGADNTAVGYQAGVANTSGQSNVFIGASSGLTNTTGEENIVIGTDADTGASGAINRIVIGDDATGVGDNKAVIGNDSITEVYMSEDAGATVYASGMAVVDESDLTIGNVAGDLYLKVAPSATAGNEDIRILNTYGTDEASVQVTSTAGGIDIDAACC